MINNENMMDKNRYVEIYLVRNRVLNIIFKYEIRFFSCYHHYRISKHHGWTLSKSNNMSRDM